MDLQVLSFSRLGARVLEELGGGKRPMINKQGRHMLLTKILKKQEEQLSSTEATVAIPPSLSESIILFLRSNSRVLHLRFFSRRRKIKMPLFSYKKN